APPRAPGSPRRAHRLAASPVRARGGRDADVPARRPDPGYRGPGTCDRRAARLDDGRPTGRVAPGRRMAQPAPDTVTRLRARQMLDVATGRAVEYVALVIQGDRIARLERHDAAVPEGAEEIDLGDLTLMPGLIDAHLHFWGADCSRWQDFFLNSDAYRGIWSVRDAADLLQPGFTSVRCCGGFVGPQVARAIDQGVIPGPRVVAAGHFIIQGGGTWDPSGLPEELLEQRDFYADGEDECRRIVRRRIRHGARMIKIGLSSGQPGDLMPGWGDDPWNLRRNFSLREVRAMVAEAHEAGVKLGAHAIGDAAVTLAL